MNSDTERSSGVQDPLLAGFDFFDGDNWELASRLSQLRPFFAVLRQLRETQPVGRLVLDLVDVLSSIRQETCALHHALSDHRRGIYRCKALCYHPVDGESQN